MANVYDPASLNIKPPPGGFAQGGWYSGRQYWAGTLSEPGVEHPQSGAPSAGQAVSPEVIAQTAPENVAYIEEQRKQAAAAGIAPAAQYTPSTQGQPSIPGLPSEGAGMPAFTPPETINLPELYKSLTQDAGVRALEEKYSQQEKEFIEAKGKINDNPFLSEATRVGRIAKIESLFAERTANLRGDIATKKADVEMQLNLQMKQFDINSQQAQLALSQFNTFLGMGALDNATGEDIAGLTRSTGIPSSMIYSAIAANKKKNVNTQMVTSTAENGEVWAVAINSDTGEIINKTSLGIIGNVQTGRATTATKNVEAQFTSEAQTIQGQSIEGTWWGQFPQLVVKYAPYMTLEKIYSLYLQSELGQMYGTPTENPKEIKELYDYAKSGKEPEEE